MPSFDQLLNFVDFLQKFRKVERGVLVKGEDRNENDGEHSYSLAMLAWYINATYKLDLNNEKLFKYALAHDLVETYAGDVYFHKPDDKKHEREDAASRRIAEEFREFPELHQTIGGYENKADKEAKFIYALDKIEPVLSIYLDGGRTWRRDSISLEMLDTMKMPKVAVDHAVAEIFKQLIEKLSQEHNRLFTSSQT